MILHVVIQCSQCKRYLASDIDKMSKNWERRRYFDAHKLDNADTFDSVDDVIKAMEDGGHKGGLCPACQKGIPIKDIL